MNKVVVHYLGPRLAPLGSLPHDQAARVGAALRHVMTGLTITAAVGSLAAGSDIIAAEAMLQAGAQLHIVLPFGLRRFRADAVIPCGDAWPARFDAALRQASSIEALPGEAIPASEARAIAARRAADRALTRARVLGVAPMQIAIWDEELPRDEVGRIDREVREWQRLGLSGIVISPSLCP